MLVLTRKVDEKIQIGDHITIVITKIAGDRVSIGINAPPDVRILRNELPALEGAEVKPTNPATPAAPAGQARPVPPPAQPPVRRRRFHP